jgi:hypothetical protein
VSIKRKVNQAYYVTQKGNTQKVTVKELYEKKGKINVSIETDRTTVNVYALALSFVHICRMLKYSIIG